MKRMVVLALLLKFALLLGSATFPMGVCAAESRPVSEADSAKDDLLRVCAAQEYEFTPKLCLLYTSPSPRDLSTSRMPSSA